MVSEDDIERMDEPISKEQLLQTLKEKAKDKSPQEDGWPMDLFTFFLQDDGFKTSQHGAINQELWAHSRCNKFNFSNSNS